MDDWGDGEGGGKLGGGSKGKGLAGTSGEVDLNTKAGTAWSHSYLNQKPWHPLSYPNQRRKWIAEQTHANKVRRQEEVAREFAQEQEFFRQTALFSQKEKEKVEMMKAVSFMYVRPPGYNAESAKAAEIADEQKTLGESNGTQDPSAAAVNSSRPEPLHDNKKKSRPKDVFGRTLPTEEEFDVLKNAPRLETGAPVRIKPFAVEVRNVRCVRCGTFGHQSGDRECPLKDAIMPNDESRLKRDDPLTAIMAQTGSSEPLKWELKQRPGMSPPRGGFKPDDPNQQIVAEDIFDEYGGFLIGGAIPNLLSSFSAEKPHKKHSKRKSKHKHKNHQSYESGSKSTHEQHDKGSHSSSDSEAGDDERRLRHKHKKHRSSESGSMPIYQQRGKRSHSSSSDSEGDDERRSSRKHHRSSGSGIKSIHQQPEEWHSFSSDSEGDDRERRSRHKKKLVHSNPRESDTSSDFAAPKAEHRGRYLGSGTKLNSRHKQNKKKKKKKIETSSDSEGVKERRSKHKHRKKTRSHRSDDVLSSSDSSYSSSGHEHQRRK